MGGLQAWLDPGVPARDWLKLMSLSLSFLKFFPCFAFFPALVFYGGEKVVTAAADYLVLTNNLIPEGEKLTFFSVFI